MPGSGIGQLTAIKFLELGAKVVIWDVSSDGMDKTVQMMREAQLDTSKVFCYKINLSDRNAIYQTGKTLVYRGIFVGSFLTFTPPP